MELWNQIPKPIKKPLALGFSLARSGNYFAQNLTLPFLEKLITGHSRPTALENREELKKVIQSAYELIQMDAQNISEGLYPLEVLAPERPHQHLFRWGKILVDGVKLSRRRAQKKSHDFGPEADDYLDDVPEYYRRNFHFQTDGYMSEASAELYEHQVEILFVGVADAMRRLLIPSLKKKWPHDGQGLHFLELASGTGRLTKFMKLAFPKAKITVTDVSEPYLRVAQKRLRHFKGLNFLRASAEDLPFKNASFDLVYSCFLFHEIPMKIRAEILQESRRVLKANALVGIVDSVQEQDTDFTWALKQFPVDFHEPFYKNYIQHPLEDFLTQEGFSSPEVNIGFFAKSLVAKKARR